jgi:hypothetical protein
MLSHVLSDSRLTGSSAAKSTGAKREAELSACIAPRFARNAVSEASS